MADDVTKLSDDELKRHLLQSMPDDELRAMMPRRSPLEMLGRQAGLTARAGIEGIAGIPLAITDAPTRIKRARIKMRKLRRNFHRNFTVGTPLCFYLQMGFQHEA